MCGVPLTQEVSKASTATEVGVKEDVTTGGSCAVNKGHIGVKIPEIEVHKETRCYTTTESYKEYERERESVCVCVCVADQRCFKPLIIYDLDELTSREAKDIHHRGAFPPGGDSLVAVEERNENGGDAEQHSHNREGECCMDSVQ